MKNTISLRPYQVRLVDALLSSTEDVLAEQPTGSGKTIEIVAVAAKSLPGRRVLISTTQRHIEHAFTKRLYSKFKVDGTTLEVPAALIQAARSNGSATTKVIREYLAVENQEHAIVCTHSALTKIKPPTDIPKNLSGSLLCVDEAHHAPALGLSQFVHAWKAAGGRVMFFTATGYRADKEAVALPGMRMMPRTLPQHMEEGYAPAKLHFSLTAVYVGGSTRHKEFTGKRRPRAEKLLVEDIATSWLSDHRPKTIVRVPPSRGGSMDFAQKVADELHRVGARVLLATGQEVKEELLEQLQAERYCEKYEDSQYDVIVGIQRVAEGMDWKWCSHVYCVGLPNAVQTTVQLLGRATRKKNRPYPGRYREVASVRFFVPCGDRDTLSSLPEHHARRALITCSFLADCEAGDQWHILSEIGRGVKFPLSVPTTTESTLEEVACSYPYLDPRLKAEARGSIRAALSALHKLGTAQTAGNVFAWVRENDPTVSAQVVRQLLVEYLMDKYSESMTKARRRLIEQVNESLEHGHTMREAFEYSFGSVLQEFMEDTITESESDHLFERHTYALSHVDIGAYAERLWSVAPVRPEWLSGRIRSYARGHKGQYPTGQTLGGPARSGHTTWAHIDGAIREGSRGWPLTGFDGLESFARAIWVGLVKDHLQDFLNMHPRLFVGDHELVKHLIKLQLPPKATRHRPVPRLGELPVYHGLGDDRALAVQLIILKWYEEISIRCSPPELLLMSRFLFEFESYVLLRNRALTRLVDQNVLRGITPELDSREKGKITSATANSEVLFRVPVDRKTFRLGGADHLFLTTGQYYFARLLGCPYSQSNYGALASTPLEMLEDGTGLPACQERTTIEKFFGVKVYPHSCAFGWPVAPAQLPYNKKQGIVGGSDQLEDTLAVRRSNFSGSSLRVELPLDWVVGYLQGDSQAPEFVELNWSHLNDRLNGFWIESFD